MFKTILFVSLFSVPMAAEARPKYFEKFYENYSDLESLDSLRNFKCGICHINPQGRGTRTDYGNDFRSARRDFSKIEALDSDGDGISNLDEIIAGTNPGDSNSK